MRTNALLYSFLAVLLSSSILQLYITNYIQSSNESFSAFVEESNNIPGAASSNACEGVHISTLKCPRAEYHQALDSTYTSVKNTDLFRKCSNLPLPLTDESPIECWPRLIILPSHTTSGSKLFRGIWDMFGVQMSQFYENDHIEKLFTIGSLDVFGDASSNTAIPFMQQPLIFKSHIPQENYKARQEMEKSLREAKSIGVLHGIVRIARNPGDQLIRNKVRWGKSAKIRKRRNKKQTIDEFIAQSKKYCKEIDREGMFFFVLLTDP